MKISKYGGQDCSISGLLVLWCIELTFFNVQARILGTLLRRIVVPIRKLEEFLNRNGIRYVRIIHSPAYTAQEIAESAHVPGKFLAKTVIVNLDDEMVMAVLPAPAKIDIKSIADVADASLAEIARETDFKVMFPNCEIGAMPPFGNLFGMDVFIDESLTKGHEIAFNAGNHKELIRLLYKDYEYLVNPRVASFAAPIAGSKEFF